MAIDTTLTNASTSTSILTTPTPPKKEEPKKPDTKIVSVFYKQTVVSSTDVNTSIATATNVSTDTKNNKAKGSYEIRKDGEGIDVVNSFGPNSPVIFKTAVTKNNVLEFKDFGKALHGIQQNSSTDVKVDGKVATSVDDCTKSGDQIICHVPKIVYDKTNPPKDESLKPLTSCDNISAGTKTSVAEFQRCFGPGTGEAKKEEPATAATPEKKEETKPAVHHARRHSTAPKTPKAEEAKAETPAEKSATEAPATEQKPAADTKTPATDTKTAQTSASSTTPAPAVKEEAKPAQQTKQTASNSAQKPAEQPAQKQTPVPQAPPAPQYYYPPQQVAQQQPGGFNFGSFMLGAMGGGILSMLFGGGGSVGIGFGSPLGFLFGPSINLNFGFNQHPFFHHEPSLFAHTSFSHHGWGGGFHDFGGGFHHGFGRHC